MKKCFNKAQILKSSDVCGKFSKSVSYETLVIGAATIGRGRKQTRRVFLSSADKPLSAVGTLTSLLCNSAKVMEKLLRHVITRRTLVRRGYLPEQGTHANEESLFASVTWLMRLPRRIQRSLRMTIPTLAFLLSLNLSPAFAGTTCNWDGTKLTIDGSGTFNGCPDGSQKTATEVTIGTDVTSIGWGAFKDASSLTSITIPDSVTSIGDHAFAGASSLTSITIPEGVTSIGVFAFHGAKSLTSITIPDSVTSIGTNAFNGASSLTSITIPDSVTYIGGSAFKGASSLESITIPEGVTSIGNSAFLGASSLKSITIPEGVTSIGRSAFHFASSLESITIPDSVTSIGNVAFYGASSLESITIPEGVTSIGASAFNGASSLTSITIPEGVTSIGEGAFYGTGLTSITIPDSVTSIGYVAFSGASSLTSITIPDNINTANWSDSAFRYLPAGINIVCQGGLNTCYEKLAKYFTSETCPQNLKDAGKGNLCSCSGSCISPTRVSEATQNQCGGKYTWDETSNPKCRHMTENECANSAKYYINNGQCKSMPGSKTTCKNADFLWSESSCVKSCASGFVEWDKECLSEYPFAKKRWTPAEANQWLHDGNDNFVVITFKK